MSAETGEFEFEGSAAWKTISKFFTGECGV